MKLNYKRTIFVGFAFMSICAFWSLYDSTIPLILTEYFGMGETLRGFIMALDNVLALILLPLFGALSDKTKSPLGKRTFYIVIGTSVACLMMLILPMTATAKSLFAFLAALFILLLAMSFYRSPAVALMPDLTPKPLRSKANAIINLAGAVGGVVALLGMKFLIPDVDQPNYFTVYLVTAAFMVVCVVILILTIKENKLAEQVNKEEEARIAAEGDNKTELEKLTEENKGKRMPPQVFKSLCFLLASVFLWFFAYNAITTAFTSYAREVWGLTGGGFADCLMVATVAAVLTYIPVGFLSSKFGRKKLILIGIIIMGVALAAGVFFSTYTAWINILFALVGIGWATINVNSYPMVVEMSKSGDIGKYTGLYYTFSMAAQILTPVVSGACLEFIGYKTLFPYGALFCVAAFITMLFVKHGDVKPNAKKSVLEHLDVDD